MANKLIRSTSDLPNKWRLFGDAYQPSLSHPKAVIKQAYKDSFVAITNEGLLGSENSIIFIVLAEKKNNYSRLLKILIERFSDGKKIRPKFDILDCSDPKVIDAIYKDHDKRNGSKNTINMDEEGEGRVSAVLDLSLIHI